MTERVTIETGGLPDLAEAWAKLTQPLDTTPPIIITDAERAASDAYIDELRRKTGDPWEVYALSAAARENTDLLAAAGHSMIGYDGTLSDEAQAIINRVPEMLP